MADMAQTILSAVEVFEMNNEKKMRMVSALECGTVIDHLPGEAVLKLLSALRLDKEQMVSVGINFKSKTLTQKGFIKLNERYLNEEELNKVAIIAPDATLNVIENYDVVEKKKIELRRIENGLICCNNPKCITNHENIFTQFTIVHKDPLTLRCHYCERSVKNKEIIIR